MRRAANRSRNPRWQILVVAVLLGYLLVAGESSAQMLSPGALKSNLDLPYDAAGEATDDAEAPAILAFYGESYEASAVVFALDESGSMDNHGRWQLQTREIVRSILELPSRAEFGVVYYGSRVSSYRNDPVPATSALKGAGISYVHSRRPGGDTCIGEGVVRALEIVNKAKSTYRAVIVTSDGRPDVCATGNRATPAQVQTILQRTLAANPGGRVRVHTIFVGRADDTEAIGFMRRLARLHGGTFRLLAN